MPILIAILSALTFAAVWYYRLRAARQFGGDIADAANDVRLAARRFGYKRKVNVHPVDSIEDSRLAAAGVVLAIAQIDRPLSQTELDAMRHQAQLRFNITAEESDEIVAFGRWIAGQCGTPEQAMRRMGRLLRNLVGPSALPDLKLMIEAVVTSDNGQMGVDERYAVGILSKAIGA